MPEDFLTEGKPEKPDSLIYVLCRYGEIYGPIPFEMISENAWGGDMAHASHDIAGWRYA